ncbi:hypothetical protein J3F84DRAFT_405981 [Trichoderma pleuroticola]
MLLRKRRRLRAAKSCYPCRRRKVKCNLRQPCGSCVIRGHPELCDYSVQILADREQLTQPGNISDGGLYLDPLSHYSTRVHVGYESLPSLVSIYQTLSANQPQPAQKAWTIGPTTSPQTVFELLCLQDLSTMFPFTNIWAPEDGLDKVYSALPEDEAILRQFCQESLFSILPPFINFPQLEVTLSLFLRDRAKSRSDVLTNPPLSCTSSWFALLFSILACGVQLASSDVDSEILKARVFACCSFQCLRFSNFLSFPNAETVQTLILLLNFLRNQANAGASWSLLGTRSLIWQDTLISLCYARPLGINVLEEVTLTTPTGRSEIRFDSFSDSSHNLFMVANKIGQALQYAKCVKQPLSLLKIHKFKDLINQIESRSLPHIRDVLKCQGRADYFQHCFFRLFSDSIMLCLCRPAVLSGHHEYGQELGSLCMSRCRSVLRTYLELLKLNNPLRRSWIFMHVTLSCALCLGVTADIGKLKSDKILLKRFFDALLESTICLKIPPYANALKLLGDLIGNDELDK